MDDLAPVVVKRFGVKLYAFQEAVAFVDVLIKRDDRGVALGVRKEPGISVRVRGVLDARIGENLSPCQTRAVLSSDAVTT